MAVKSPVQHRGPETPVGPSIAVQPCAPVQRRTRRDRIATADADASATGSAPHTQGTACGAGSAADRHRFSPAHAGDGRVGWRGIWLGWGRGEIVTGLAALGAARRCRGIPARIASHSWPVGHRGGPRGLAAPCRTEASRYTRARASQFDDPAESTWWVWACHPALSFDHTGVRHRGGPRSGPTQGQRLRHRQRRAAALGEAEPIKEIP